MPRHATTRIIDPAIYDARILIDILTDCRKFCSAPDPRCEAGLVYPPWVRETQFTVTTLLGAAATRRCELRLPAFPPDLLFLRRKRDGR
jgi:hypothetical protein